MRDQRFTRADFMCGCMAHGHGVKGRRSLEGVGEAVDHVAE